MRTTAVWWSLVICFLTGAALHGQTSAPAETPTVPIVVDLWPDDSRNNPEHEARPTLEIFLPFSLGKKAPATIVILPGGGYSRLSPYERLQAEYFRALGYAAVAVNYRVRPNHHPAGYADVTRAIRLIRQHGQEWNIPSDRVVLLGGSAGGHLAALVTVRPDLYQDPDDTLAATISARPDALILLYPVIQTLGLYTHASIDNLLGPEANEELKQSLAPESYVTAEMPPTLIFHAVDDPVVHFENSLIFARACWAAGVPAELHIFPHGGHGKAFAYDPEVSPRWRAIAQSWLALRDHEAQAR